jgi:hypothetical protein
MSDDIGTSEADPESSIETVNNKLYTDLQQNDWGYQPHVLSDRADVQYTDKGWRSTSTVAADAPVLSPSSARTTFYPRDIEQSAQFRDRQSLFNRLWKRQWNRGQKEVGDNNLVRKEAMLRHCDSVLQQCEVPEWARRFALKQVRVQNIKSYNSHYLGADGACVGFAAYRLYSNKQEAIDSYVARRAADVLPGLDKSGVDNLIDYTFRTWNND